jgi:hypothetical protein
LCRHRIVIMITDSGTRSIHTVSISIGDASTHSSWPSGCAHRHPQQGSTQFAIAIQDKCGISRGDGWFGWLVHMGINMEHGTYNIQPSVRFPQRRKRTPLLTEPRLDQPGSAQHLSCHRHPLRVIDETDWRSNHPLSIVQSANFSTPRLITLDPTLSAPLLLRSLYAALVLTSLYFNR